MKKRILFIITQSGLGGAQKYLIQLIPNLDKLKYQTTVAAGQGSGELLKKISKLKAQNSKLNLNYQTLKHLKRTPVLPWEAILAIKEINELIQEQKPDIVFLCSTTAGILGSIAAKLTPDSWHSHKNSQHSYSVVYRIGGWAFRDPRPFFFNKIILWAEKLTSPFKERIIVNSKIDKELAEKYKICPSEKISLIYNGINPKSLQFLPREEARKVLFEKTKFELQTSSIIVGTIANLYKTKGLEYLIKAFSHLEPRTSNIELIIIGEGKERKNLEALIKEYNLESRVFLLGKIPNAYMYLKALDIFVLPSVKEGFPWVVLEAMASGVPIIATKVGAIPEVITDGEEGLLVKPGDSQELAKKIKYLIENPKLAQNLGNKARGKVREFPLQKMLEKTESLLLKLSTQPNSS